MKTKTNKTYFWLFGAPGFIGSPRTLRVPSKGLLLYWQFRGLGAYNLCLLAAAVPKQRSSQSSTGAGRIWQFTTIREPFRESL